MKLTIQFLDQSNGSRSPAITNHVSGLPADIDRFRSAFLKRLQEENSDITESELDEEENRFNTQLVIVVLDHDGENISVSTKPLMNVLNFVNACENAKEPSHA